MIIGIAGPTMADVFISYARADQALAKGLADSLVKLGYSVWWDHALVPGDGFSDVIARQIDQSKAMIVVWSPSSVQSQWVKAEAQRALEQDKLVPLMTDDIDARAVPLPFGTLHTQEIGNIRKLDAALQRLGVPRSGPSEPEGSNGLIQVVQEVPEHWRNAVIFSFIAVAILAGTIVYLIWPPALPPREAMADHRATTEKGKLLEKEGDDSWRGLLPTILTSRVPQLNPKHQEARKLFESAASAGFGEAKLRLADMLAIGKGGAAEPQRAAQELLSAAKAGPSGLDHFMDSSITRWRPEALTELRKILRHANCLADDSEGLPEARVSVQRYSRGRGRC